MAEVTDTKVKQFLCLIKLLISHRLPAAQKKQGDQQSIIVKFVRRDVRDAFYKARSRLKREIFD